MAKEAGEEEEILDPGTPPAPESQIHLLPHDVLHRILLLLPLRQAVACRPVCLLLRDALSSPPVLPLLPSLPLLALRHPRLHQPHPALHALDFTSASPRWLILPLSFLPSPSCAPVASSSSLLYLWADPSPNSTSKSLIACNPLTRTSRVLPPLGSAWSRHGAVLAGPSGLVIVLTELAALSYSPSSGPRWLKFSLNLPKKPRSPVLIGGSAYALCDVGSPWRSQWKLFSCGLSDLGGWDRLERHKWGDVFDIVKRPRLLRGGGSRRLLMIGGLRSSFALEAPCSTVMILRLDLETMEWDEAGRMPEEMYRCFAGVNCGHNGLGAAGSNNKVKVFGGDGRVWFSGKRVRGKMAMWEEEDVGKGGGWWTWVDGVPGYDDGVYRGLVLDAALTDIP